MNYYYCLNLIIFFCLQVLVRGEASTANNNVNIKSMSNSDFNYTTNTATVAIAWGIAQTPITDVKIYRIRCTSTIDGQDNRHVRRIRNASYYETEISGMIINERYECCVVMELRDERRSECCRMFTPRLSPNTENSGTAKGSDMGLYVIIALLCVALAVCVVGWLGTAVGAYIKFENLKSSLFKDRNTLNTEGNEYHEQQLHNPTYGANVLPDQQINNTTRHVNNTSQQVNNNTQQGHIGYDVVTDHKYDVVRGRETMKNLGLPAHYETMASYAETEGYTFTSNIAQRTIDNSTVRGGDENEVRTNESEH